MKLFPLTGHPLQLGAECPPQFTEDEKEVVQNLLGMMVATLWDLEISATKENDTKYQTA